MSPHSSAEMLLVVESAKTVEEVSRAVGEVCARHQFGLLGSYDLRKKLKEKGLRLERECRVFEVCNPRQAQRVLTGNPAIATALPCRIAVYEEGGSTRVATIRPTALLSLFLDPELLPVAQEVERTLSEIMQELA